MNNSHTNITKKLQLVSINNNSYLPDENENLVITPIDLVFSNSSLGYFNSPKNDHDLNMLLRSLEDSTSSNNPPAVITAAAAVNGSSGTSPAVSTSSTAAAPTTTLTSSPFKLTASNFAIKNGDRKSKGNELCSSLSSGESIIDMFFDIDNYLFETNSTVDASNSQISSPSIPNCPQTNEFHSNYKENDGIYMINSNSNLKNNSITNVVSPLKRSNPSQSFEDNYSGNQNLSTSNGSGNENVSIEDSENFKSIKKTTKSFDETFMKYNIIK